MITGISRDLDIYEGGIIGIEVIIEEEGEQYIVLEPMVDEETGEDYWVCYGQDVTWEILPDDCQ